MCLPTNQVDRFFHIWLPLLHFANNELRVVPNLSGKGSKNIVDINLAVQVRGALWRHEELLNEFIEKNPAQLSRDDLRIVENWKYRRLGKFFIFKFLKKHAIFISQDDQAEVFAVKGLQNSFEEIFGVKIPILVETVLLPFGNEIIADGLLASYNILFGSGIRGELKIIYDDAMERGELITSLLPNQQAPTAESLTLKTKATNTKVLKAFSKYLYVLGRSTKIVERDVTVVERFAEALFVREPISLLDFGETDLQNYVEQFSAIEQKSAGLSLKRFISFLRDTERMDWNETQNLLEMLQQESR
jgi:hypothetical protein